MADAADRTEKPTPKRLREAREKGQIPRSRDLAVAAASLASVMAAAWFGGHLIGKVTDQLAHEGLVERADVEGDRRAYRVRLTAKGRRLFQDMAAQHERWIVDAFAALGDKDVATLHRLLGRVKEHSQSSKEETP